MVPSDMVGDRAGIFTSVPGVDPPVGPADSAGALPADSAPSSELGEVIAVAATSFQSSPSSATTKQDGR